MHKASFFPTHWKLSSETMKRVLLYSLLPFLVLSILIIERGQAELECPGKSRRIFAYGDAGIYKSVTAASTSSSYPVTNLLSSVLDAVWCAYDPSSFDGNEINITFASLVMLDTIVSNGDIVGGDAEYVSQAMVYYASPGNESVNLLKTFSISSQNEELLLLDQPVLVQSLRIVITSAVTSRYNFYCWNLQLIGCHLSDATMPIVSTSTITKISTQSLITTTMSYTVTITTGDSATHSTCSPSTGSDHQLLVIVLLPVVLLVVVFLGVTLAMLILSKKLKRTNSQSTPNTDMQIPTYELNQLEFVKHKEDLHKNRKEETSKPSTDAQATDEMDGNVYDEISNAERPLFKPKTVRIIDNLNNKDLPATPKQERQQSLYI